MRVEARARAQPSLALQLGVLNRSGKDPPSRSLGPNPIETKAASICSGAIRQRSFGGIMFRATVVSILAIALISASPVLSKDGNGGGNGGGGGGEGRGGNGGGEGRGGGDGRGESRG